MYTNALFTLRRIVSSVTQPLTLEIWLPIKNVISFLNQRTEFS